MPSPETSADKPRIGKIELDYLTRIGAAMQNPVQSSTVKMWLTEAAEKGLDPETLYERAVNTRPPHWMPAPPFSDVTPPATSATSEMLTPSELAQLRQAGRDADVYLQKVYPNLRIL